MRHILVTGTSRGFGQQIALKLADEQTHLYLVARSTSRSTRKAIRQKGGNATEFQRDLTDYEQLENLVSVVFSSFDPEDADFIGLVNNAGTLNPIGPLGKYEAEAYQKNLEINFVAPAVLTHMFVQKVQDLQTQKRVVFVSSGASQKPYEGWSHYCSTKAGIDMLMKTACKEQQKMSHPVKMIGFNPGRIETDMQELIRMQSEEDFPAVQDFIDAKTDGRTGSAEELAEVLAELVTAEEFPTGQVVNGKKLITES